MITPKSIYVKCLSFDNTTGAFALWALIAGHKKLTDNARATTTWASASLPVATVF